MTALKGGGGRLPDLVTGVVLDIEGTTTPVSFVVEVLFPYARAHVREYLRDCLDHDEVREATRLLREEWAGDEARGEPVPEWRDASPGERLESLATYIEWLMDRDRKSTGLKRIQGQIWERGYTDGTLRGEVYPDVRPALERWHGTGMAVAIYSSGSVLAQRLLFSHSTSGDLTPFIDQYFDTGIGAKRDVESYRRIAAAMGRNGADLLFISDVAAELDAARAAGFATLLCFRSGDVRQSPAGVKVVRDFNAFGGGWVKKKSRR